MKFPTLVILLTSFAIKSFAQPTITSFTSSLTPAGSAATGTTVTINGTNFTGATAVSFGGTPAASYIVVTSVKITAAVGNGSSGNVSVTTPSGTATKSGFYYLPLSGIITDFGGFWPTTTVSPNSTNPNTSHNLLAFTYNGTTYSTGVSDATLNSNGITTYTSGSFKAIPVAGIAGTSGSGGSTYIALAKNVDGNSSTGDPAAVSSYTIKKVLTDGTNGLDLGTGVTNLPVSAILKYNIGNIVTTKIADAEPDIIITQIADPSTGNDVFQFVDASSTPVGNSVTQDMTLLNPLGTYVLDLFTLTPSTSYNTASAYANYQSNVTRQIRMVAFKLSDFGITAGNAASVRGLLITPSGNSDYAFIAYNANALNLPPGISQNSSATNTSVCAAGIANLAVIANAAGGGTLTYSWERSTNGGTTWTAVTDGGNFSGATTNQLNITAPANNDQYRATVAETGSALTNTSDPFTITLISPAAPTAVTVSGTTTTCINNSVIISSSVTGGSNLYYQWQSNTSGSYVDIPGANLSNYSPPVNVAGFISYKLKASSGNGCTSLTSSNAATITVSAATVAGSTSGGSTVCSGTNSTTLTLSGNTGSVTKWQSSTDNFATYTDISNTTTSLIAANLTATTKYRVVVQSGVCAATNSTTSTVTVNASIGGTISGSATVCSGSNTTTLTLSGYTGSIIKWQSSTDNFASVINDIANTTTTLTATNLTATTQYRAVIQYGSCAAGNSAISTVTVNASVGGSISGNAIVCTGTNSTTLNLSGNTGSVVKWQSSTDNFSSVITDIANTTTTLTATNLTTTTQYRVVVQNGSCTVANSSTATVTVNPASVGGSISGSATVCSGTNFTTLTLSGYTGSIIKWQSSTDNFSSVINDIENTTNSLTATNLTATTQYRTVVQSDVCASANSSAATITVNALSVGGSISGSAIICSGTNSTTLTLSGYTGSIVKWQSSTDNFTSIINDIANTTTSLTATNLTTTTQYRAVVQSGVCAAIAYSNTATITVNAQSIGGTIMNAGRECAPPNNRTLTLAAYTGDIIKWQSSTDNFATVTDIANTTNTYTAVDVPVSTRYRVVVQNGVCPADTSSVARIRLVTTGEWVGASSGDWNVASNWCGGIPPASADILVPAFITIRIQSADMTVHSITIENNGNLVMQNGYNLNIQNGGSFINSGSFNTSASTGKVSFLGNGTVSGTTTFKNIETSGALDFGTASTVTGNFTIQPGGSVTGNAPAYTCPSSNLVYNTGGIYSRGIEWMPVSSGAGYPSNVIIQNNTAINFPIEGDGYICNDLAINAGSALYQDYSGENAALSVGRNITINGTLSLGSGFNGDIRVGGNWTRNAGGVFNNNQRSVTFGGTSNSIITAPNSMTRDGNGAFGGETFYNLFMDKTAPAAGISLGSNISVLNEISFIGGIFDLINSDVTMVSNASATAHIAPLPTSSGIVTDVDLAYSGTGKFVIQRYLNINTDPSSRRWRLLTVPLDATNAPTINEAWQEGVSNADRNNPVNPWPGFGTTITKSNIYDPSDGYDQGSRNNPSLYYFSGTGWKAPSSTYLPINNYEGYMLFARGSRNIIVSTPNVNANPTTLEPKGRVSIGDIDKPLAAGFQPIGNPYASAIDFSSASFNNYVTGGTTYNTTPGSSDGLGITYYIWDPETDGTNGVGKFITCSSNGDGTYAVTANEGGVPEDGNIPSGTAFMITADNGNGSITFHEADKLNSDGGVISRPLATAAPVALFTSRLYAGTGSNVKLADAVINAYANYSNAVNGQDAISLSTFNSTEALGIARSGALLSVERRSRITVNDTIFLSIKNLNTAAYQFRFKAQNFDPGLSAVLEDKFTGISTPLSVTDSTDVPFNITSSEGSSANDRFRIIFKPLETLPVTISNVKAFQQNNNIAVQWTVENQLNITRYEVEKSNSGANFITVSATAAFGNQKPKETYNWLDENAAPGEHFYRIKYINANGTYAYSKVIKVAFGSTKPFISVYPNPVIDGNITLQLNNLPAGKYHVRLSDKSGRVVYKMLVTHSGGNSSQTITPGQILINGSYDLDLIGPDKKRRGLQLIIQSK